MKISTVARLLTLTLAALMLLTACGTSDTPEDTTPENEYTGLYQPNYLKWPTDMPNVRISAVNGNNAYALVDRGEGESIERVTLPDCTMTTLVNIQSEEVTDDIFKSHAVVTFYPTSDGVWYGIYTAIQDDTDPSLMKTTTLYELVHIDNSGVELARMDISETLGTSTLRTIAADNDGNVVVTSNDKKYYAFDNNGQHLFSGDFEESALPVRSANGSIYLWERISSSPFTNTLVPVDFDGKKMGDAIDITSYSVSWINSGYGDEDFYLVTSKGIYAMSLDDNKVRSKLDFSLHGIDSSELYDVSADEKGDFYGLETSRATSEYRCLPVYLQAVENMSINSESAEAVPPILQKKIELTYATIFNSQYARQLISEFNKNSSEYVIRIIDYNEKAGNSFRQARELFLLDITAGNIPDIFDIASLNLLQEKWDTLVLDLYPFLDADPDYHRDAFVPSVLSALEYNDKLFRIGYEFELTTLVGKESIFGSEMGWSFDDLLKMQDSMSENTFLINDMGNIDLLYEVFFSGSDRFISEDGSQCYFNSNEFISLLEWCATLPLNSQYFSNHEITYEQTTDLIALINEDLQTDKTLLTSAQISSPRIVRYFREIFGDNVNFIGYPGSQYGAYLYMHFGLSISSNCQYPEGAWEFVRTMFPSKVEYMNLPILVADMNTLLETEMTPLNERDETTYHPSIGRIIDSMAIGVDLSPELIVEDTPEYDNYHLTQEEVDQFMDVINAVTTYQYYDAEIWGIIEDATAPFFAGGKSAEETAKEVQSRVSILLAERS